MKTDRSSKFGVTRIYTANVQAFRSVIKTLTQLNCEFWNNQLRDDKPYRLGPRDIHTNVPKYLGKPDWRDFTINEEDDEQINSAKTRQNMFYINIKRTSKTCANCGGRHIASFKGCKVRVEKNKKFKAVVSLPENGLTFSHKQNRHANASTNHISRLQLSKTASLMLTWHS